MQDQVCIGGQSTLRIPLREKSVCVCVCVCVCVWCVYLYTKLIDSDYWYSILLTYYILILLSSRPLSLHTPFFSPYLSQSAGLSLC